MALLPNRQPPRDIDVLRGLHEGKKPLPWWLVAKVLDDMPPSAALQGLGLMEDSHSVDELNAYINGRFEAIESQGKDKPDDVLCAGIRDDTIKYIMERLGKDRGPDRVSPSWRSFAVGVLVRTVKENVNLAVLKPEGVDRPYLDLTDMNEPDMSYEGQQFPQNQAWPDDFNSFTNLSGGLGEGYQSPAGSFQQAQGPFMAGGQFGFNMSPSPQPNLAARRTPEFGPRFGSPLSQHASFTNQDHGHISSPYMPQSLVGSPYLTPHALNLVPSPITPVATALSPLPNDLSRLRMSPSPDYRQSLSPIPSRSRTHFPWPQPSSPAQSIQQNIQVPGSPLSPISNLFSGANPNIDGYSPAGQYQHGVADMHLLGPSINPAHLGPVSNIDMIAPVDQYPYHNVI